MTTGGFEGPLAATSVLDRGTTGQERFNRANQADQDQTVVPRNDAPTF